MNQPIAISLNILKQTRYLIMSDPGLMMLAISAVLFQVIVIVAVWHTTSIRRSTDDPEEDARREEQERREGAARRIRDFEERERRHELEKKRGEQRKQDAAMLRELARRTASLGRAEGEHDDEKAPLLLRDEKNVW